MEAPEEVYLIVDEAIDFLAKYFEMDCSDDNLWDSIKFPKVEMGRDGSYFDNVIELPSGIFKGDSCIGHETGHWLHDVLNTCVLSYGARPPKVGPVYTLVECVGSYSGTLYANQRNPFVNPEFTLRELAMMTLEEAKLNADRLYDFYWGKLIPESGKLAGLNLKRMIW